MDPVLRAGDKVLVAPNAAVRRGDRVVVKTLEGEVMAKELRKLTESVVELVSLNPEYEDRSLSAARHPVDRPHHLDFSMNEMSRRYDYESNVGVFPLRNKRA